MSRICSVLYDLFVDHSNSGNVSPQFHIDISEESPDSQMSLPIFSVDPLSLLFAYLNVLNCPRKIYQVALCIISQVSNSDMKLQGDKSLVPG